MRCYFGANDQRPADRIAQLTAELADARAQLAKVRHDRDEMIRTFDEVEAQRDAAQADAAAMRAKLVVSWPEDTDPEAPNPAGSYCIACDRGTPDDDEKKVGPEHIQHADDCPTLADAGRALAARVPLWRELERRFKSLRPFDEVVAKLAALDKETP
jgi:hypothetical protein